MVAIIIATAARKHCTFSCHCSSDPKRATECGNATAARTQNVPQSVATVKAAVARKRAVARFLATAARKHTQEFKKSGKFTALQQKPRDSGLGARARKYPVNIFLILAFGMEGLS